MSIQFADYPDWVRMTQSILPVASISQFPTAAFATGATFGPFLVAQWPTLQVTFTPHVVAQMIQLTWTDGIGGPTVGTFQYVARPENDGSFIVRNQGSHVTATVFFSAGGTRTADLYLSPSARSTPGWTLNNGVVLMYGVGQVVAAGGTLTMPYAIPYFGPVKWFMSTTATNWSYNLWFEDQTAARTYFDSNAAPGLSVHQEHFCEPFAVRGDLTNNNATPQTFAWTMSPLRAG